MANLRAMFASLPYRDGLIDSVDSNVTAHEPDGFSFWNAVDLNRQTVWQINSTAPEMPELFISAANIIGVSGLAVCNHNLSAWNCTSIKVFTSPNGVDTWSERASLGVTPANIDFDLMGVFPGISDSKHFKIRFTGGLAINLTIGQVMFGSFLTMPKDPDPIMDGENIAPAMFVDLPAGGRVVRGSRDFREQHTLRFKNCTRTQWRDYFERIHQEQRGPLRPFCLHHQEHEDLTNQAWVNPAGDFTGFGGCSMYRFDRMSVPWTETTRADGELIDFEWGLVRHTGEDER